MDKFVCRTCLYGSQNITTFRTVEKVKNILELLVPEIKPNITRDSIICTQCYYFLKNVENFKQKCIDNQKSLLNRNVLMHQHQNYFPVQRNQLPQNALPGQTFYDYGHQDIRERQTISPQKVQKIELVPEQSTAVLQSTKLQKISVIKDSKNVDDKKRVEKYSRTTKTVRITKQTDFESDDIVEISDEEVEMNDESTLCYSENSENQYLEDDDIFEEKSTITIVKNDPDAEENPSFFNKKSEEGFYDCKLCNKKYKNSKGLYEHTLAEHNQLKFFHCNLCNFFTLWKSALSRHESLFHAAEEIACKDQTPPPENLFLFCYHCTFKTKSKEDLIKHIEVHFNNRITTYTCCKCHKNFHKKYLYDLHVEAHEKGRIVCCVHCKQFYTMQYLKTHLSEAHGVSYEKYYMYHS